MPGLSITTSPGIGATSGTISQPGSPCTRIRPHGPAPPISAPIRAERQRLFAGRSDRSGEWPSRVWITNMPVERAWASIAAAPGSPARVSPMS